MRFLQIKWTNINFHNGSNKISSTRLNAKKKRNKASKKTSKLEHTIPEGATVSDYLQFGSYLGQSAKDTLSTVQGKFKDLKLDQEAKNLYQEYFS